MEDLFGNYIRNFIEFREEAELADIFDSGDINMGQSKTRELLTVISLADNPTFNLSVAQPSKYKRVESLIGTCREQLPRHGVKEFKQSDIQRQHDASSGDIHVNVRGHDEFCMCTAKN